MSARSQRTVDAAEWATIVEQLVQERWTMAGLWGEHGAVHMALLDHAKPGIEIVTLACPDRRFPSVARHHPPAHRLERAIRDLFGLEPVGTPDDRPWLRHEAGYAFLSAEGEGLHQVPVGPVHAGTIEPGHFRFTANGETLVRVEQRLGYAHKGVEALMAGAPLARAAKLAARLSGDSTVAFSIAFARAAEDALRLEIPVRAHWLRALMAELERLANHIGDIGAICHDASFALMHAHTAILRERVLRNSDACFSHRLMMDRIVPGGAAIDLDQAGTDGIVQLLEEIRRVLPRLVELYDDTASLQDRTVGAGTLSHALVRQYGSGGYVGRASGRSFDARRDLAYPPYDSLRFEVPVFQEGDVNARVWVRIREIEQSLSLVEQILQAMPPGEIAADAASIGETCQGVAMVEGFRGDILCWLRLAPNGAVERCHLRDPSWFQWPLLEAAIEGDIIADFPLCNKSFNCSYSGHDL